MNIDVQFARKITSQETKNKPYVRSATPHTGKDIGKAGLTQSKNLTKNSKKYSKQY